MHRRVKVTDVVIYLCLALFNIEPDTKFSKENLKKIQRCRETKKYMTLSEKNPKRKKKQTKTKRKKQNNVVLPGFCYREKDRKNGWLEEKKQLLSSSFRSLSSQLAVVVVLAQCAPPERLT